MCIGLRPVDPRLASGGVFLFLALALPASSDARQPQAPTAPDKGAYHLFRPTPGVYVRELSTDRPDQTESPYTVDAGRFQLELDFVSATVTREPRGDLRLGAWSVAPFNAKIGLLNRVDLQIAIDTYSGVRVERLAGDGADTMRGFGNVVTRLKMNLWGNDGGRTAFGVMGFVRWPLPASDLRSGRTEGGVIFPLAVSVADGWSIGAMTEVDALASPAGGYAAQLVNSITIGHALSERLGMYVEVLAAGGLGRRGSPWLGQLDVGWTYGLRDDIQLDCGANFGLTELAPTVRPFAGLSLRF
jgi:hypothetical protein